MGKVKITKIAGSFDRKELGFDYSCKIDYSGVKYAFREWSEWFISEQKGLGLGYSRSSVFSNSKADVERTENTDLIMRAVSFNKVFELVAKSTFINGGMGSAFKKAEWLESKGVDMGGSKSAKIANYLSLKNQMFAFTQGYLIGVDDDKYSSGE